MPAMPERQETMRQEISPMLTLCSVSLRRIHKVWTLDAIVFTKPYISSRKRLQCEYTSRRRKKARPSEHDQADVALAGESEIQHDHTTSIGSSLSLRQSPLLAVYFLDSTAFHRAYLTLPRADPPVSKAVADLIGDAACIHSTAEIYFKTIHFWMPIVSKNLFYQHLLNPLSQRRTELSLLIICMKLISSHPPPLSDSLYKTAKQFHLENISAGVLSTYVLQAGVLIALYELGHAIYPSAFLSVGACARFGIALGIDKTLAHWDSSSSQWDELEEKRRVWWSILILDR